MQKEFRDRGDEFSSCILLAIAILITIGGYSQTPVSDSLLQQATLQNVIQYALEKQPVVQQSLIDEESTESLIKSKLADWYPQVNFNYFYQHNFQRQTTVIGGNVVRVGVGNTSVFQFTASQNLFNRDVILASKTKDDIRLQAKQQTENTKIDLVVNVSKAFYDVLATEQQVIVVIENIVRLEKSLKDARAQYDAGVVDKTDYKRATIALNNAKASKITNEEALKAKKEYLKALMNYPQSAALPVVYDSMSLENEITLDTLQVVEYSKRIEYMQLQTQKNLLEANLKYNKWDFFPTLSANGAYNLNYLNNDLGKLFKQSFPNSYAGLTLAFPIFQGGKRNHNIRQAEWELKRTELDIVSLRNLVNTEYTTAIAIYKASLSNYQAVKENVLLAQEVYDIVNLQYRSGIKTYLEVVNAETDLRTSQINYFNALYQVLSSKIDVQKSLGDLKF